MSNAPETFDVIVVGGGPAGMMTAGTAAARGLRVLLIEKNKRLGEKLLITGGGRSNVTNNTPDPRELLPRYGEAEQFLYSPFATFGVSKTLDFFHTHRMPTKVENEARVFPASDSAQSVWNVLVEYMRENNVHVRTNCTVSDLLVRDKAVTGVQLEDGSSVNGNTVVVATGGLSRPDTGSTGDGFAWLKKVGHDVRSGNATLVPVAVADAWVTSLSGVALPDVHLFVEVNGRRRESRRGKILFTHFGLSGPALLNLSSAIGAHAKNGPVTLVMDLLPGRPRETFDTALRERLREVSNKHVKNVLSEFLPSNLIETILSNAGVPSDKPSHSVTREERVRIVDGVKSSRATVLHLMGFDMAVATGGGVALADIDTRTMESRKVRGLYLVGDMLDIDRPSGGYSLQLCWTTGYVAGMHAGSTVTEVP